MLAVLLAAGRSKRLWPIEDKNFLSFLGKPLIQHQIELLQKVGCSKIGVVGGTHNVIALKQVAQQCGGQISVILQKDLDTGLAGGVLTASTFVKNEPFILFSSNDVLQENAFDSLLKKAEKSSAHSLLLGARVDKYFPGGYMKLDSSYVLERIVEKPKPGKEPSDMVNVLLHLHKDPKTVFGLLEKASGRVEGRYEEVFNMMIKKGMKIEIVPYRGFWQALKYPWHVLPIGRFFFEKVKKHISKKAKIAETAVINGEVIIDEGVRVFDYAVICGPCYLGKDTLIGNHSLVRESYIEKSSVIGFSSEIARSYLGKRVWTHSNYIGDSVIGDNCAFGCGTVTGNFRLDEKEIYTDIRGEKIGTESSKFGLVTGHGVRVGINTSFMPGVKVGSGAFVGAGIVVSKDIPDNTFVTATWDLQVRENLRSVSELSHATLQKKLNK